MSACTRRRRQSTRKVDDAGIKLSTFGVDAESRQQCGNSGYEFVCFEVWGLWSLEFGGLVSGLSWII